MATMNVTVRMERDIKEQADALFGEMGISLAAAVNMFVRQSLREGGLPFTPSLKRTQSQPAAAQRSAKSASNWANSPNYDYLDELFEHFNH